MSDTKDKEWKTISEMEKEGMSLSFINEDTGLPYEMSGGLCIGKRYYTKHLNKGVKVWEVDEEKGLMYTRVGRHIKVWRFSCSLEDFKRQFSPYPTDEFIHNDVEGFKCVTPGYQRIIFTNLYKDGSDYFKVGDSNEEKRLLNVLENDKDKGYAPSIAYGFINEKEREEGSLKYKGVPFKYGKGETYYCDWKGEEFTLENGICINGFYYTKNLIRPIIPLHVTEDNEYVFFRCITKKGSSDIWRIRRSVFDSTFSITKASEYIPSSVSGAVCVDVDDKWNVTKKYKDILLREPK